MIATRALRLAPLVVAIVLAACSSVDWRPVPPTVAVPEKLRPPATDALLRTLWADGVQIYECRAKTADASAAEWVFVAPEAALVDAQGTRVGRHYAGPTWEANDGSKVVGAVSAKVDSHEAGAIPWLLLATHSTGKAGMFSKVSSMQRVATVGGAMPETGCSAATIGQVARVPYQAQYTQYAPIF